MDFNDMTESPENAVLHSLQAASELKESHLIGVCSPIPGSRAAGAAEV